MTIDELKLIKEMLDQVNTAEFYTEDYNKLKKVNEIIERELKLKNIEAKYK
jgi:hypothetical protein